jgi:hypothetical protein
MVDPNILTLTSCRSYCNIIPYSPLHSFPEDSLVYKRIHDEARSVELEAPHPAGYLTVGGSLKSS